MSGGLGNQLFQYAMGLVLARKLGVTCYVDPISCEREVARPYLLGQLQNPPKVRIPLESRLLFGNRTRFEQRIWQYLKRRCRQRGLVRVGRVNLFWESRRGFNVEQLFPSSGAPYLVGVWQSHLYWKGYEDVVHTSVALPSAPGDRAELEREVQASESVAVHVRRTDFIPQVRKFVQCLPDYYIKAVRHVSSQVPKARYFVFSDDIEWCRTKLTFIPNVEFVTPQTQQPMGELRLMSLCRHHIICNSTFSWWGAWLKKDQGITVCPKIWYAGEAEVVGLYPDNWITFNL